MSQRRGLRIDYLGQRITDHYGRDGGSDQQIQHREALTNRRSRGMKSARHLTGMALDWCSRMHNERRLEFADGRNSGTGGSKRPAHPIGIIFDIRRAAAVAVEGGCREVAGVSKTCHHNRAESDAVTATISN